MREDEHVIGGLEGLWSCASRMGGEAAEGWTACCVMPGGYIWRGPEYARLTRLPASGTYSLHRPSSDQHNLTLVMLAQHMHTHSNMRLFNHTNATLSVLSLK